MRKILSGLLLFSLIAGPVVPAFAEAVPFSDDKEINLSLALLPPPPAIDSPQMKGGRAWRGAVPSRLHVRPSRRRALKPMRPKNIWRFADVVNNPKFTAENLPKFAAFF